MKCPPKKTIAGNLDFLFAELRSTLIPPYRTASVASVLLNVFRTDLNAALLDGTERGREFLVRTPTYRFGKLEKLAGAAIFLSSDATKYVTGHLLVLASGANQLATAHFI
jgi:NAD(P)-dependent dehydrogenase (short-subunit alcohol dehydrogenase family)